MAFRRPLFFIIILLIHSPARSDDDSQPCDAEFDAFNRTSFPKDFIFGASSSAYQYEGAANIRQQNIWDIFVKNFPEKIADRSNGNKADEFYSRYKHDVSTMKDLGLDAFRISISWSRLINYDHKGNILINEAGLHYYKGLIKELQRKGAEPFVTLFHWDTPQFLEHKYGGFRNELIVFMQPIYNGHYPQVMRKYIGKRLPVFNCTESKMLKGSHDFVGLNYYTAGYANNVSWKSCKANVNKNYYRYPCVNITKERNGKPIGPKSCSDWLYSYPRGILDLLVYTKNTYKDPVIYITENGFSTCKKPGLHDLKRKNYHYHHLKCVLKYIKGVHPRDEEGVGDSQVKNTNVKGYLLWSLLDDFEWNSGYSVEFGLIYVNNNTMVRKYKHSARWYKHFLNPEKRNWSA